MPAWRRIATVVAWLLSPMAAAAAAPDSVSFRAEVGAGTDVTNEQFYEDAFVDTVALGRRLVSDPESRVAAVASAAWRGTRGAGRTRWEVTPDLSVGDRVSRGSLALAWRDRPSESWRWSLAPRAEYRRDRTFDRDLDEWRAAARARLQRDFGGGDDHAGLGLDADLLRTRGPGADFLPDRNTARLSASFERSPLLGPELRIETALTAREFPDSSTRNHLEWRGIGDARWAGPGGSIDLSAEAGRRRTSSAPTSRDDFWEGGATASATVRGSDVVSGFLRLGGEILAYAEEDSTYYSYRILRAHLGPGWERGAWTARIGPRGELLRAHITAECYDEIGAAAEIEYAGAASWWSVTPAAGWRGYHAVPPAPSAEPGLPVLPEGRSSYAFYELDLAVDQALAAGLRLRVSGTGRQEVHTDGAQDSRSLYFSLELRRLF